jgi:hypothetical protein
MSELKKSAGEISKLKTRPALSFSILLFNSANFYSSVFLSFAYKNLLTSRYTTVVSLVMNYLRNIARATVL